MVKGVTRQVVVVKSPAPKIDEAIFLLREPVAPDPSSEREALRQALRVADEYILQNTPQGRRRRIIQPILFTPWAVDWPPPCGARPFSFPGRCDRIG